VTELDSSSYKYDVCLSFAGEQRRYVESVAGALRDAGIRVFYDNYERAYLWGKDLYQHLDHVYQHAAHYCVVFASTDYARKVWTSHELRSAQARALRENQEYILPARFDHTEIPGLRSTVAYIDLTDVTASELVGIIIQKVRPSINGPVPLLGECRQPIAMPISDLTDPFDFEVHRSIEVASESGAAEQPVLPPYVRREHDERLMAVVKRSTAGNSALAVLVGGSSTGKSRACWEVLHELPEGWRLWHPISPTRSAAALQGLPYVGPCTVLWLSEAQHYFLDADDPGVGEQVAAELRQLLRTAERAPVLVLATMWPRYWAELCTEPEPYAADLHEQARALLVGAAIHVPDGFTEREVMALRQSPDTDPRLACASRYAENCQVTQYLAGVPVLLDRYNSAPTHATGLIHAAMELRRLGLGPSLPQSLLAAAAPAYLTDTEWEQAGEGWLEQSLAYTSRPCRGIRGPLTRIRPRPHQPLLAEPHYRLADYLEEMAETARPTLVNQTELLDAFFTYMSSDNLASIAHITRQEADYYRTLYLDAHRTDEALAWLAARLGARHNLHTIYAIVELAKAGRVRETLDWQQRLCEIDQEEIHLRDQIQEFCSEGYVDEVLAWLRVRLECGHVEALELTARTLRDAGRFAEAITWYGRAAEAGDQGAELWSRLLTSLRRELTEG
jgi:hypothetical protein